MKRTLAVLLTFFVLTYSACADELVDVAWHVDSEMLGEFLASCGFNEKIAATVSDAAEYISAHLSGKASVREDGSFPRTVTEPESLKMRPKISLKSVVFPAPFWPMSPVIRPSGTSRVQSRENEGYVFLRSLTISINYASNIISRSSRISSFPIP